MGAKATFLEKAEGPPGRCRAVGTEGGPRLLGRNMPELVSVPALPPTNWEGRSLSLRAWEDSHGSAVRIKCDGGIQQVLNKCPASKKKIPFFLFGAGGFFL